MKRKSKYVISLILATAFTFSTCAAAFGRYVPPGRNGAPKGNSGGGTRYAGGIKTTGKEPITVAAKAKAKVKPKRQPKQVVDGSRGC